MTTETIRGYKVEYDIDPKKARILVKVFLNSDVRCTDGKHAIMTINNIRIRFKYEGMKREYIEIKELKKKTK
jgi:hypothetical protein